MASSQVMVIAGCNVGVLTRCRVQLAWRPRGARRGTTTDVLLPLLLQVPRACWTARPIVLCSGAPQQPHGAVMSTNALLVAAALVLLTAPAFTRRAVLTEASAVRGEAGEWRREGSPELVAAEGQQQRRSLHQAVQQGELR